METKHLFKAQKEYDKAVMRVHGLKKLEPFKIRIAMMDEVGELIHSLKKEWCWWKFTQVPTDWDAVVEELVDVLHFALSFTNWSDVTEDAVEVLRYVDASDKFEPNIDEALRELIDLQDDIYMYPDMIVPRLVDIAQYLGLSGNELEEAYFKKLKKNQERLTNGY